MRIIVCGDRHLKDMSQMEHFLTHMYLFGAHQDKPDVIISGGAGGADYLAKKIAHRHRIEFIEVVAEWTKYHKAAGPKRNAEMLKYGPDMVIGFHENISQSRGTQDMLRKALYAHIPTWLVEANGAKKLSSL